MVSIPLGTLGKERGTIREASLSPHTGYDGETRMDERLPDFFHGNRQRPLRNACAARSISG